MKYYYSEEVALAKFQANSFYDDFTEFHEEHPEVYDELKKLALDLVGHGHRRYSINGLFEVLRWHRAMRTTDDEQEDFKLNNNYRALYARLLMLVEPRLRGFFETRVSPGTVRR